MNTETWQQEEDLTKVSIEEFDRSMKAYREARETYEKEKEKLKPFYATYEQAEGRLIALLKATGKKGYKTDGVGGISLVVKDVVTVPKDLDSKRSFFQWVEGRYGLDVLDTMRSVNHQTLNSFYNEEAEKEKANPMFNIPGIPQPTSVEMLSFRRES